MGQRGGTYSARIIRPVMIDSSIDMIFFCSKSASFAAIALKLWNQLPLAIRQSNSVHSFKRALKMHL